VYDDEVVLVLLEIDFKLNVDLIVFDMWYFLLWFWFINGKVFFEIDVISID